MVVDTFEGIVIQENTGKIPFWKLDNKKDYIVDNGGFLNWDWERLRAVCDKESLLWVPDPRVIMENENEQSAG